jgi:hypothetical protein
MEAARRAGRAWVTSRSRREEILRQRWLEVLRAELASREEAEGGELREQRIAAFRVQLNVIAERLRSAPGYVEPTDAEKAQWRKELDAWFRSYASRARR